MAARPRIAARSNPVVAHTVKRPVGAVAADSETVWTSPTNGSSSAPSGERPAAQPRGVTPARIGFLLAFATIYAGWSLPTERMISPERGLGYALGIIGGSAMLLLLLYPVRKRLPWFGVLGTVKGWFRAHMLLGVIGPILVLYHCNFSLGATNSNAALFAMLLVSGSGVFGRYFYTRIHFGLYGRRASRAELQRAADELRAKVAGTPFVPRLLDQLDEADRRLLRPAPWAAVRLVWPVFVSGRMMVERWRIDRLARRELRAAASANRVLARQHASFEIAVRRYIRRRLDATRRVAEFESYERLFSLWHVLHLPLFLMLLIAGVVHVVAVHVY